MALPPELLLVIPPAHQVKMNSVKWCVAVDCDLQIFSSSHPPACYKNTEMYLHASFSPSLLPWKQLEIWNTAGNRSGRKLFLKKQGEDENTIQDNVYQENMARARVK